jgi:hypothetical protein
MSVNKYRPHVLLIPEDDANRQLANGFLQHYAVDARAADLRAPAGGWPEVLAVFEKEYIKHLRNYQHAHVIMLIDFDDQVEDRKSVFAARIPDDVKSRVFVIGSKDEPETLERQLSMPAETIGRELAQDCLKKKDDLGRWGHPHLSHNRPELERLVRDVKQFLFQGN